MGNKIQVSLDVSGLTPEQVETLGAYVNEALMCVESGTENPGTGAQEDDGPPPVPRAWVPTLEEVEAATMEELQDWLELALPFQDRRMAHRAMTMVAGRFGTIILAPFLVDRQHMLKAMAQGHEAGADYVVYGVHAFYQGGVMCVSGRQGAMAWTRAVDRLTDMEMRMAARMGQGDWWRWWERGTDCGRSSKFLLELLKLLWNARVGGFPMGWWNELWRNPAVPLDHDDLGRCVRLVQHYVVLCGSKDQRHQTFGDDGQRWLMDLEGYFESAKEYHGPLSTPMRQWRMLLQRWCQCRKVVDHKLPWRLEEWWDTTRDCEKPLLIGANLFEQGAAE